MEISKTGIHEKEASDEDTIAAVATPMGQAGIGIVRLSGPLSLTIIQKIFRPKKPVKGLQTHRLYLGQLLDPATGGSIDEVLVSYMQAPNSYTREDVVEINAHSGYILLSMILQVVLDQGARLARPGEFTFRAFLNGRIDLTQAEAITHLIHSHSERGVHLASQQIRGSFRRQIETLRENVTALLAQTEVSIDFPEEDIEILPRKDAVSQLKERVIQPVAALIEAHEAKKIWVDGIPTVIIGRVNAGKSSLLNRLSNEERAIVTSVPGTTRDIVSSFVSINGLPLRLMDTAGFGHVKNELDQIGVGLAEQKLAEADFALIVIDQSRSLNQDDFNLIHKAEGKKAVIVANKIDLPSRLREDTLPGAFPIARISALTGDGLAELKQLIVQCIICDDTNLTSSDIIPNMRHKQALSRAAEFFKNAAQCLDEGLPPEIIAFELKNGLDALGEIIGETTGEDILDSIFSRFCLGK